MTPLKRGRTEAREAAGVTVVSEEIVSFTLERCTPTLQAMIRLQLQTAMRPGELVIMRPLDINTNGSPWFYRPGSDKGKFGQHKTAHHGLDRRIYLGKESQRIIEPFMSRPLVHYLFSPREADAQRRDRRHQQRRTPQSCGNKPGTNRKKDPKTLPGDRYTPGTYRQAIHYACDAVFDPDGEKRKGKVTDHLWSPNQLRHTALTRIERRFGCDRARAVGGHTKVETTQIYVERDMRLAIEVAQEAG